MKISTHYLLLPALLFTGCATTSIAPKPTDITSRVVTPDSMSLHRPSESPDVMDIEADSIAPVGFTNELYDSQLDETETDVSGSDAAAADGQLVEPYALGEVPTLALPAESGYLTQTYTLAELEGLALSNNPTLASARALVSKSAGLRYQVGRYPNPLLGYFGQQMADRNTDQHGIFVEQEFVRGDKLKLNREVLGHTQRAQSANVQAQRYRVLTDVRVRFFEAIAAQQRLDAIRDFLEVARKGVQVAEERQEAEEGTLVETLQASTLLSEITLAEEQATVAFFGAWRDLAAIAGIHGESAARLQADMGVPAVETDWDAAYAEIVAMSPELAAARAIVCEKSALYRRQQVQPIPNVTAQLGAGYDDGTNHGMINAQLSAPIPVWNKNCGNIKAAYSDYVRAKREVQRIEQSIRSRLARVAAEFESSLRSVRKYEDEIIPQTSRSLELSEEAYRAGELDFLQVLIVRRSFFESTVRLIDAKGSLAQAASKVDGLLLTGGLDAVSDYTDGDGIRGASFGGQ